MGDNKKTQHDDSRVSTMRALAHPVRLQILSLLTGSEMSAAEIARELGITHANASYHLRFLADAGQVVEAGEVKIRGGLAKRYRHPWDLEERSGSSNRDERQPFVTAMADELVRRFRHRSADSKGYFSDAEMWVTPEVWARVTRLVQEASHLVHAEAKRPRAKGTVHVNMTSALFQMGTEPDGEEA